MSELAARLSPFPRLRIGGLLIWERNAMVYRRTWMILFSQGSSSPVLPRLLRVPARRLHRRHHVRRRDARVRRVRRARPARRLGDERGVLRRDERVLEAPAAEGLQRDAGDADQPGRRRGGGDDVGRRALAAVLVRLPGLSSSSVSSTPGGGCSSSRRASSSASASPGRGSRRSPGCAAGRTSS